MVKNGKKKLAKGEYIVPGYREGGVVHPDKVHKVMHEFKHGELHSGSKHGPKVTGHDQAIAIALSEQKKANAGGYAQGGIVDEPKNPVVIRRFEIEEPLLRPGQGPGAEQKAQHEASRVPRTQALEGAVPIQPGMKADKNFDLKYPDTNKGAGASYAGGGPVVGPGGPTSDSVPIDASNGEFVVPADVVSYLGEKFFKDLIAKVVEEKGEGSKDNQFEDLAEPNPGSMM